MMLKGIKFRIYPNEEQKQIIEQTFGCCRLIYNKALAMRKEAFENNEKIGYKQTSAMLTELKAQEEFAFLKEADSVALQQALRDLDMSFSRFFKKYARYPRFRKKSDNHQAYRTLSKHICFVGNCIKLPKLGYVKVKQSMEVGQIRNVTVERSPSGRYFVVVCTEFVPKKIENKGNTITLYLGTDFFYKDNNGNIVNDPPGLDELYKKMQREQKKLSRKESGSKNREKQRIKLARVHERLSDKRNDFLQKLSTELIRENQTIIIDDSEVRDKGVNYLQSKSVSSISYCKFIEMLKYKAQWYGNEVIVLGEEEEEKAEA